MREKIHYLKFCMSCSAGQAGHLASPLHLVTFSTRQRTISEPLVSSRKECEKPLPEIDKNNCLLYEEVHNRHFFAFAISLLTLRKTNIYMYRK